MTPTQVQTYRSQLAPEWRQQWAESVAIRVEVYGASEEQAAADAMRETLENMRQHAMERQ